MIGRKPFHYKHPHPAVATDLAVFTLQEHRLHVLLIERGRAPFKGAWALPGGFVRINEDLHEAATRELEEETGVVGAYLEQAGAFGHPARDPRERVISIAFFAIIASDTQRLHSQGDAASARWCPMDKLPKIAFDHANILVQAQLRLRDKLRRSTVALRFLPPEFTLTELQQVHEAILGELLDKRNFRKWVAQQPYLVPTGRMRRGGSHRPAELYRGKPAAYVESLSAVPGADYPPAEEALIAAAYQRGYQDATCELGAAMDTTQRELLKRLRSA
jgi:8-oxo-dGTP diphosphatase